MAAETKFRFRPWSNILPSKRPECVIEGVLLRGRLGVIFAQPENGKTFLALAAALSVGTGEDFAGRKVIKGCTIYIAAEGEYDLEQRVPAWRKQHHSAGEPIGGCYGDVVNFFSTAEVEEFIKELKEARLELLVIDTMAAVMVGGDEDRAKDVNILLSNVRRVMKAAGCAALIVHHAGWDTKREKGSIALRAAADVVFETKMDDAAADGSHIVTLTCHKMRGMPKFESFSVALVPVLVESPGGVFTCLAVAGPVTVLDHQPAETERHAKKLVRLMFEEFPDGGTSGELERASGMSNSTFKRALAWAKNEKWFVGGGGQGARYNLNPDGCWNETTKTKTGSRASPYRGLDPVDPVRSGSMNPVWTQFGPGPGNEVPETEGCKSSDTTDAGPPLDHPHRAVWEFERAAAASRQAAALESVDPLVRQAMDQLKGKRKV